MEDIFQLYGVPISSRLMLGSARYPSLDILSQAIRASGAEILTVSLRRESTIGKGAENFWNFLSQLKVRLLPNTAGCYTVQQAVATAHMAREIFNTNWLKLELIGEDYLMAPEPFQLVEAARILISEDFKIFPYVTEDLSLAERLLSLGCELLMPWASPIGSGGGLNNPFGLKALRNRLPKVPLILDAGIGRPSHAVQALEWGYDGILLNTAVATAGDPVGMAHAFQCALQAGRRAYLAQPMEARDFSVPSTPPLGQPFL